MLEWEDYAGIQQKISLSEGEQLWIRLKRGESSMVIARVFTGNDCLRPAAGLYPRNLEIDSENEGFFSSLGFEVLRLDYMSGYLAELAACLEKIGKNPWVYPLERVAEELARAHADPWAIPPSEVAEALALHGFRIDKFFRKGTETVLPESTGWISDSPFCVVRREGVTQKAELREGVSVFYDEKRKLLVSVEEAEILFQIVPRE